MASGVDRRGFFRRMAGSAQPVRPPWSHAEPAFAAACDGCGDCIRACPQAILLAGGGGLPQVDFARGACTFCGDCVRACTRGAFLPGGESWALTALIGEACLEPKGVTCRVCETVCDAAALRFRPMPGGRARVIVEAERCTGCGACVSACPASAISIAAPETQPQAQETVA
jgi:ferredoxin-type protein NapF